VIYLTKEDIIEINKSMALKYESLFISENNNVFNDQSFDYMVEVVKSSMFGQEIYPEIFQKASVYFFYIIQDHIFNDGNKRTALEAALIFIEKNNYVIKPDVTPTTLINLALDTASHKYNIQDISDWFKNNIQIK
jgi:death on curing protein